MRYENIEKLPKDEAGWYLLKGKRYCWIDNSAIIHKTVMISERVTIAAWVTISERVTISEGVTIAEGAEIKVNPLYIKGTYHIGYYTGKGRVGFGCIIKPLDWWEKNRIRCGEKNGYTSEQIEEYGEYIELFRKWIERYDPEYLERNND